MELISSYFPDLTKEQHNKFSMLGQLYAYWNEKINVVSRKDIESLYEKHVLHSLGIASFFSFMPGSRLLDVGTGGGFPGIPLAIMFPECHFTLCDSIAKKVKVVEEVRQSLDLKNVSTHTGRAENFKKPFDVVLARAVTRLLPLYQIAAPNLNITAAANTTGLITLKGGDLAEECDEFLEAFPDFMVDEYHLSDVFEGEFFETKKILHVYKP